MGVIIPQVLTEDKASGAQIVDGSLRFDSSKSHYLNKTPGSAGNRRTWTWSGWVKIHSVTQQTIFSAAVNSSNRVWLRFNSGPLEFQLEEGGAQTNLYTNAVYRDTSAWYHIVVAVDTTQATSSDRSKIYINGEQVTSFSAEQYPTQNYDTYVNATNIHRIGSTSWSVAVEADSNMTQCYIIDGQALGPGYFGFTDPLTNTWRPKKFRAEGTTVNDGTVWSNYLSSTGALGFETNGFNGDISVGAYSSDSSPITFTPPNRITYQTLRVYTGTGSGTNVVSLNGGADIVLNNNAWTTVSETGGSFTTLTVDNTAGSAGTRINAIEVDGVTMVDSTTTNLAFGTNGFYLPFDGNSPIGQDQSGRGNNWTPVNFGGSNTLEKATGALPILNTDGGGKVARPGVFGSEVGKTYTVTVPGGIGGGFYLDGTQKPALSLIRGATYTFDQSDSSNSSHPLVFGTTAEGNDYSDGVTTNGTPGSAGAYTKITVPHNAPDTLYYHCSNHSGMGNSTSQTTNEKVADTYAWKNVLALPLVGVKDDVSNQINSGSTTKTITANGNAAASSAQSNFYGGSFVFDGTGDYVYPTQSSDFSFGTGDFTVECWGYATSISNTLNTFFDTRKVSDSTVGFGVFLNSSGQWRVDAGTGSGISAGNASTGIANKWYHVALVRDSGTVKLFVDGNLNGSVSNTTNLTSQDITIGYNYDRSTWSFTGYIQDFRVYKGVAKYTQNFIPASTDPDILPDTPSGVSYSSNVKKITDGAVSFDGSGDYLNLGSGADYNVGTGDFTFECFAYYVTKNDYCGIFGPYTYSNNGLLIQINNSNCLRLVNPSNIDASGSTNLSNRWVHIAVSRSGTTLRGFINGIQEISTTYSSSIDFANGGAAVLGVTDISTYLGTYDFKGFLSNVHFVKGTALYTSNFTPPTAPLTNVTNTKLLCCQSNTSATAAAVTPGSITNPSSGYSFNTAKIYSVYNGGTRSANFTVEYSDDNSNWTTAFTGTMTTSGCGVVSGSGGGGDYGKHNYWRYTNNEGTGSHHPRMSRLILSDGTTDVTIQTFTSDNCSDSGTIPANGASYTYTDTTYAQNNASATNFNPFTTDINTVRGQESGYATLNPLKTNGLSLSDGNLKVSYSGSGGPFTTYGTIGVSSGKWYFEHVIGTGNGSGDRDYIGITDITLNAVDIRTASNSWAYMTNGRVYSSSSYTTVSSSNVGDTIMFAFDMDAGTLWVGKNGTWFTGSPSTGLSPIYSNLSGNTLAPTYCRGNTGGSYSSEGFLNFGQKPFKFPPPDGFQPLNAANVRPTTVIARPDQYVGIVTYTGNGSNLTVNTGFQPDLVWCKIRTPNAYNHTILDSVRGFTKSLSPSMTVQEYTEPTGPVAIIRNGFTLNGDVTYVGSVNQNASSYVAWSWKAGGNSNTFNVDDVGYATASAAGLTAGTITPTGASVGTKQGFSIISYGGSGSSGTFSHGLSQEPDFVIVKQTSSSTTNKNWCVYHRSLGGTKVIVLNSTATVATTADTWNDTDPTSTLITLGAGDDAYATQTNVSGKNYICYAWHDVPGLQKFGSWVANNNADGNMIITGFRPRWIMAKQATGGGGNWFILDTTRNTYNPMNTILDANLADGERSAIIYDALSNGFKIRIAFSLNETFVYAAFAEAPSFNLYGAQSNAR